MGSLEPALPHQGVHIPLPLLQGAWRLKGVEQLEGSQWLGLVVELPLPSRCNLARLFILLRGDLARLFIRLLKGDLERRREK